MPLAQLHNPIVSHTPTFFIDPQYPVLEPSECARTFTPPHKLHPPLKQSLTHSHTHSLSPIPLSHTLLHIPTFTLTPQVSHIQSHTHKMHRPHSLRHTFTHSHTYSHTPVSHMFNVTCPQAVPLTHTYSFFVSCLTQTHSFAFELTHTSVLSQCSDSHPHTLSLTHSHKLKTHTHTPTFPTLSLSHTYTHTHTCPHTIPGKQLSGTLSKPDPLQACQGATDPPTHQARPSSTCSVHVSAHVSRHVSRHVSLPAGRTAQAQPARRPAAHAPWAQPLARAAAVELSQRPDVDEVSVGRIDVVAPPLPTGEPWEPAWENCALCALFSRAAWARHGRLLGPLPHGLAGGLQSVSLSGPRKGWPPRWPGPRLGVQACGPICPQPGAPRPGARAPLWFLLPRPPPGLPPLWGPSPWPPSLAIL